MSGKVPGSEVGRRQAPERDERQLMRFAERLQEPV